MSATASTTPPRSHHVDGRGTSDRVPRVQRCPTGAAAWTLPDEQPRAYALFAHCFTCSKDVLAASRISQALTGYGIAVLRFDFTGLGGSGGDFASTELHLQRR